MALKEVYHTVASTLPTDADTGTIPAGIQVQMDANALVTNITAITDVPIGIAGDTKRQAAAQNNPALQSRHHPRLMIESFHILQ